MNSDGVVVKFQKPERKFSKTYEDFLENTILSCEERMVFIVLRSFVDFSHDEAGTVYPTMETICRRAGMSRPRATRTINKLVSKGIVQKKRRGLTKSNIYTLIDRPDIWKAESAEDMRQEAEKSELQRYIEALEAAGYTVIEKEKELSPMPLEESPNNNDTFNHSICQSDSNTDSENVQYQNKCSYTRLKT